MDLNVDESRNETVVKILRSLPKVSAPVNFEDSLWRRINAESFEPRFHEKETWWEKFLSPGRLIPSAGLALATVILLFVFNLSTTDTENPLVAAPKLRSEITNVSPNVDNVPSPSVINNDSNPLPKQSDVNNESNSSLPTATFTASVSKSGYNFLQVKLSAIEKEKINRLRERIRGYFNKNTR